MRILKVNGRKAERELDAALKRFEPRFARAFAQAVKGLRDKAILREIARALDEGDVQRAVELTGVAELGRRLTGAGLAPGTPSAADEVTDAFRAGMVSGQRQLPKLIGLRASLNMTSPGAVRYLQDHLPTLIREVTDESIAAVRDAVLRGMTEGRPAPLIAREIRDSIGLTRAQAQYVANLRRQLETGELGNATAPWDRRLSATERQTARRLFRDPAPSAAQVDAIVQRYYESLVNRRAKTIARTETHRSFIEGQEAMWESAEEEGLLDPTVTRRVWIYTQDSRVRDSHAAVPGMNKGGVGLKEPFQTPVGPIMSPGEGPASFAINCFLPGTKVQGEFVAGLESWYSGEAVEIVGAAGKRLSVTPNHPILTAAGLKPAHLIREGDHMVSYREQVVDMPPGAVEEKHRPALVEDIIQALAETGSFLVSPCALDLHGDETFIQNNVRQVGADGFLQGRYFAGVRQQLVKLALVYPDIALRDVVSACALNTCFERIPATSTGGLGVNDLALNLFLSHLTPLDPLRLGLSAELNTLLLKHPRDGVSSDTTLVAQALNGGSRLIGLDKVTDVRRVPFSGHVYDLQSTSGWLVAEDYIISNCRCTVSLEFTD